MSLPDFSKDEELLEWFGQNCWNNPSDQWLLDHADQFTAEAIAIGNELTQRSKALRSGTMDDALFWFGWTTAAAGCAVVFFPPVGIPAIIGQFVSVGGFVTATTGAGRRFQSDEAMQWINKLRDELNTLLRRLIRLKENVGPSAEP